tara:strand:+ start:5739 stop:7385 length:1647 start_codon:yes stop_codon:yes gene_type:complete
VSNAHTAGVVDALSAEFPLLGIALRHHRNTRGHPMSFATRPYLVELYCDAPHIDGFDAMKAVQVGWSELLVQLILERAGWGGRIAAYVLPSYQLRDRFVKNRVNPLLDRVAAYQQKVPAHDPGSLKIKRFGNGSLLFLGSNTVNDFVEFSADVLVVDEFDRCVAEHLALARDRLRESPYPQLFRIGNPTMPGVGIAALFDHSDGRRWHHKCTRCGERQPLEWATNIVERDTSGRWVPLDKKRIEAGNIRPICRRCKKPFDRVADGAEWVAERPSQTRRGYQISRLDVLSQELRPLLHEWSEAQGDASKLEAFYRSVLGRPYEPKGMAIDREILANCTIGDPLDEGGGARLRDQTVVVGVDVGRLLHINVSCVEYDEEREQSVRTCLWVGTVQTFDQVYDILVRYCARVCVIDSRPEVRKAQELRDKCISSGVCEVWLAQFTRADKIGRMAYGMTLDYRRRVVSVDRTQLLDATLDDLQVDPPRKKFSEDVWRVKGWADQMVAPKRRKSANSDRFIWDEGNAEDHFRFADAYERVAADLHNRSGSYLGA